MHLVSNSFVRLSFPDVPGRFVGMGLTGRNGGGLLGACMCAKQARSSIPPVRNMEKDIYHPVKFSQVVRQKSNEECDIIFFSPRLVNCTTCIRWSLRLVMRN